MVGLATHHNTKLPGDTIMNGSFLQNSDFREFARAPARRCLALVFGSAAATLNRR
jgi:hypothetical protein